MDTSYHTIHWSERTSIISGIALVALFLALPTGSFWPVSFSNITFTASMLSLPLVLAWSMRAGWSLLPVSAQRSLTLVYGSAGIVTLGYLLLCAGNIHPPTGIGWHAFTYGFLGMGVGFLITTYIVRSYPYAVSFTFFAPAMGSLAIFCSITLLHTYPFLASVWSFFGLSLMLLGIGGPMMSKHLYFSSRLHPLER